MSVAASVRRMADSRCLGLAPRLFALLRRPFNSGHPIAVPITPPVIADRLADAELSIAGGARTVPVTTTRQRVTRRDRLGLTSWRSLDTAWISPSQFHESLDSLLEHFAPLGEHPAHEVSAVIRLVVEDRTGNGDDPAPPG